MGRRYKVLPPDLDQYLDTVSSRYVSVETICKKYDISLQQCRALARSSNSFVELRKTSLIDREVFEREYKDVLLDKRLNETVKSIIHDDSIKPVQKRYMRYEEAAEFYSMSLTVFKSFVKKTGAVRRIGTMVLINLDIVDDYIDKNY